ncbi:MAG: tRNA dihydrouridine synthase [Opitutales bacterium]
MSRFTDRVFRDLCKAQGADVLVSEFVQADSLLHNDRRAWESVDFTSTQRPMGAQIFGSTPESMGRAACLLADRLAPDFIDLNFGCPAERVVDQQAGSSLLREPARIGQIVAAVVRAVPDLPVTAKIRIGWDATRIVAPEVGRIVEDAGAQALAIHGRTKVQRYAGEADWNVIEATAANLRIPVIGNGNVTRRTDVVRLRDHSAVAGLMIGRAALGHPWIFRELKALLRGEPMPAPPTAAERWHVLLDYTAGYAEFTCRGSSAENLRGLRAKIKSFTKGLPGGASLRERIDTIHTLEELRALRDDYLAGVFEPAAVLQESSASGV